MSIPTITSLTGKIDSEKFSETFKANPAMNFEAEGGYDITRPRYTRPPRRVFTCYYRDVSTTVKDNIMTLWMNARGSSSQINDWEHPVSAELIKVRFANDQMPEAKYTGMGGNHRWDVGNVVLVEV